MSHPYRTQPPKAFWRKTVEGVYPLAIDNWYSKKFDIGKKKVAAAGSCFAQHIGRELREKGFNYLDYEPAPAMLPADKAMGYSYGMYSARYGNVYTSRQLLQLLQRAVGEFKPMAEIAWKQGNGFVDPFRPTLEPEPFETIDELLQAQTYHLGQVAKLFEDMDVFVFTLGLTETWLNNEDGSVYPICPGTAGGEFDATKYSFLNLNYPQIVADMTKFIETLRVINPRIKILLTVSPVPLMATATDNNVIVATSYSKSVLRAVAGHLTEKFRFVDYFPSFEIISSNPMRSMFYNGDMRTVASQGVDHVMRQFFKEHPAPAGRRAITAAPSASENPDDVKCDEELLAAFGDKTDA